MLHPAYLVIALFAACAAQAGNRPNIVVILADDFGVGLVEAYQDLLLAERSGFPDCADREDCRPDPPRTPTLNALAAQGMLFRNCWANPLCSPTRAQILTGRHAFRNGVGRITGTGEYYGLFFQQPPLPWLLQSADYRTAAVGKWHLAGGRDLQDFLHPIRREQDVPGRCDEPVEFRGAGFDWFVGAPGNLGSSFVRSAPGTYTDWEKNFNGTMVPNHGVYGMVDTIDDAVALLDANQPLPCVQTGDCSDYDLVSSGAPWMLYVSLNAPHRPFHYPRDVSPAFCPGTAEDGWFCARQRPDGDPNDPTVIYQQVREMVEAMDAELERLLAAIDLSTTYVIFLGDNGTVAAAVAPQDRNRPDLTDPCESAKAKGTLYNNGIRVPLIVAGPDVVPGAVSEALVSAIDVHATVLDLAGVVAPSEDAVSFASYFSQPESESIRRTVYAEAFNPNFDTFCEVFEPRNHVRAVRDARFKLIRNRLRGGLVCPEELSYEMYDLLEDPFEEQNLLRRPLRLRDPRPPRNLRDEYCALKCRLIELGVDRYIRGDICSKGRGDFDRNGQVDPRDLEIVLQQYGCEGSCRADADNDGVVGLSDLAIVLAQFGTECPTP